MGFDKDEGPSPNKTIEIRRVEKDTELARELLAFVEGFSWLEVREHVRAMIADWAFEDWETPFAALADGEIDPWVSTVFVAEPFRGGGISGLLIDFANDYARGLGFKRTYIPSEHVGLYEKYGYRYLKEIVSYAGGVDRLYEKEL